MRRILSSLGGLQSRAIALLGVVACAGGIAGAAIERAHVLAGAPKRPEPSAGAQSNSGANNIPAVLLSLRLSDEQTRRVQDITLKYQPVAESVMMNVAPRVAALDLRMRQEAMCVLTPQQRDEWLAARRREPRGGADSAEAMKLVSSNTCPH